MKKALSTISTILLLGGLSSHLVLAEELPPMSPTDLIVTTTSDDLSTASEAATPALISADSLLQDFTDVSVDNPYYNAIFVLRNDGVISGYSDNTFHPDQPLNRVEALKLIFEVANIQLNGGISPAYFSDIETGAWYSGYLNKATFLEVVNGYPDGTFKPEKSVNLVEFLKMLELAQKVDLSKVDLAQRPYADVLLGVWYSKYINFAKINNLIDADANNQIFPDAPLTRGRAAQIIYRFRSWKAGHPGDSDSATADTGTDADNSNPPAGVSLSPDFALYVSTGFNFAIQYPELWFYGTIDNSDQAAIRTYGFGPKDLISNPPLVTLELLPNQSDFQTNMSFQNYSYLREETAEGQIVLSVRIADSSRIYRLTGPANQEYLMLPMLYSLTAHIDGLESYNPSEVAPIETITTDNGSNANLIPAN